MICSISLAEFKFKYNELHLFAFYNRLRKRVLRLSMSPPYLDSLRSNLVNTCILFIYIRIV
jgi:hypothetical protein